LFENLLAGLRTGDSAKSEVSQEDGEPPSTGPAIIQVDDRSFASQVLRSPRPALVQFWAPWSGPCRQASPTISSLAEEFKGEILVARLNAEESPALMDELNVSNLPTLVLFKEGREIDRVVGHANKSELRSKLGGMI
jgi:thioredoxin